MAQSARQLPRHQPPPLWRDIRVLQLVGQFIFALLVVFFFWQLANNVLDALNVLGQKPDFRFWDEDNFFQRPSRWSFSEGPGLVLTDTYGRAFVVGVINTLRAVVLGIILSTILGVFIGVGRLSTNFLVRTIASAYVEFFQNTPLLVQLIFIYRGVFLTLPLIDDSIAFPDQGLNDALDTLAVYGSATIFGVGGIWYLRNLLRGMRSGPDGRPASVSVAAVIRLFITVLVILIAGVILFNIPTNMLFLSRRGLVIPTLHTTDTFTGWLVFVGAGTLLGAVLGRVRSERERRTGQPGHSWTFGIGLFLFAAVLGWLVVGTAPLSVETPQAVIATLSDGRQVIRRIMGGQTFSPEYAALMVGLILYTAAFIGEIVRAGIQAVSYGQLEAAYALGLTKAETLRRVVLPQALRVIIPPLGNQFLNLTKNSSLATAIAFMDVFSVTRTIINHTGQSVVLIITVMLTYLTFSLIISVGMNWLNARMRLKER